MTRRSISPAALHPTPKRASERGIALLIVMWMLALLALIAAGFTLTSHTDITLARNQVDAARARALADGGVTRAMIGLNDPDMTRRWLADGRPYRWTFGGGEVVVSAQDEGGKINLNTAPRELLESAFHAVGASDELSAGFADALLDRRKLRTGQDGNPPALTVLEELQRLPGMTPVLYYRLAPLMTVYGQATGVDPMTAPRGVLLVLPDGDPNEIDQFLAARAAQGTPGALPPSPPVSLRRYLTSGQAGAVTIRAHATTDTGGVFVRLATIATIGNAQQPFTTQTWQQEIVP